MPSKVIRLLDAQFIVDLLLKMSSIGLNSYADILDSVRSSFLTFSHSLMLGILMFLSVIVVSPFLSTQYSIFLNSAVYSVVIPSRKKLSKANFVIPVRIE